MLRHTKAAIAQNLLFVMLSVCERLFVGCDRDRHRLKCFEAMAEVYAIFKNGAMFLERQDALRAMECVEVFNIHYCWLVHYNIDQGRPYYTLQTKHHMFWHLVYHSRYLNPV